MASAALDLIVQLKGDAEKQVQGLSKSILGLGKSAVGVGGIVTKAIGGIALGGAVAGVGALGAALVSGIGDARAAAVTFAQTEAVIKSTGGAAGVTAQQVSDYAASLSAAAGQSLFGDDQIQQSANLLLTFKEIKGATLEAATAISVDMAQALGGAPADAAVQLGKALNDPIAGISALSRVGVTFSEDQKAVIKSLVETGDVAGAQTIILKELESEFGGSAAAAAAADGGFAQFKDRMGELAESVGAQVLPALNSLMGWLNSPEVMGAIEGFVGGLVNGLTTIGSAIGSAVTTITGIVAHIQAAFEDGGITAAIDTLLFDIGKVIPAVEPVTSWLQSVLPEAVSIVTTAFNLARDGITTFIAAYNGDWQNSDQILLIHQAFGVLGQVIGGVVVPAIQSMVGWFQQNTELVTKIGIAVGVAVAVFQTLTTVVAVVGTVTTAITGMGTAITAAGGIIGTIIAVLGGPLTIALGAVALAAGALALAWQTNFGGIQEKTAAVVAWWTGTAQPAIGVAFDRVVETVAGMRAAWDRDFESVRGFITTMQAAWDTAVAAIGVAIEIAKSAVASFRDTVSEKIDEAVAFFSALPGKITGAIGNLGGLLVGAGKSIIQGLLDGINAAWGAVQRRLSELTSLIPSWKGPPERDKKLLYESGRLIIGGLIDGFDAQIPAVQTALQRLTETIGKGISSDLSGGFTDAPTALGGKIRTSVEQVEAHLRKLVTSLQDTGGKIKQPAEAVEAHLNKVIASLQDTGEKTKMPVEAVEAHLRKVVASLQETATDISLTAPTMLEPLVDAVADTAARIPADELQRRVDAIAGGTENLADRLRMPTASIQARLDGLADTTASIADRLRIPTSDIQTRLDGLADGATSLADRLRMPTSDIQARLDTLAGSTENVADRLGMPTDDIQSRLDGLAGSAENVADRLRVPVAAIGSRLQDAVDAVASGASQIATTAPSMLDAIGDQLVQAPGLITNEGTAIVAAMRLLVDQYNAEIERIKQPEFSLPDLPRTPYAPPSAPPAVPPPPPPPLPPPGGFWGNSLTGDDDGTDYGNDFANSVVATITSGGLGQTIADALTIKPTREYEELLRKAQAIQAEMDAIRAKGGKDAERLADMDVKLWEAEQAAAAALENIEQRVLDSLAKVGSAFGSIGTAAANYGLKAIADQIKNLNVSAYDEFIGLDNRRVVLLGDQVALQEKLVALQAQQDKLGYLQQQMKLLDLLKENNLNPQDILGGVQLGLDLDPAAFADAMARAMAAIIEQVNARLTGTAFPEATTNSFAGGITNFKGGLAYVHQGEVLANLAPGTDVIRASQVQSLPNLLTMPNLTTRSTVSNDNRVVFEDGAITIVAQPGEDVRGLADRLMPEIYSRMRRDRNS